MMARAITSEEHTQLQTPGQVSKLFVAVHKPAVIMAARVNQTLFDPTGVLDITYDGVTAGSWANILPGMTIYVGSAAGLYDLGMCRIRKQPTSSVLYIGRDGETLFADNTYLTVVDDFDFWARHWFSTAETDVNFMMDQDIVYANQNLYPYPVPVFGPDAVLWIEPQQILGDERHSIAALNLTGLTLANTDNGKLYVSSFFYYTGNYFFFYKDAARTQEVVRSVETVAGATTSMGYSGFGIGGTITAGSTLTPPDDMDIVVTGLFGGTAKFTPNASDSWVPNSTITAYAWNAVGASNVADGTTATPTITYNAAHPDGVRLTCTTTAANGSISVGHRTVFVFDATHMPKTIAPDSCVGSWQDAGWQLTGTIHVSDLSDIRDRAKCVLFAEDYYNDERVTHPLGPLAGYENILMCGRIDGESIEWNPKYSTVKFTAHGPAWWMQQLASSPTRLGNTDGTPTMWIEFPGLTVDAVIHNLLYWRSTVMAVIDVYPPNDARPVNNLNSTPGSVWTQLTSLADNHILTHSVCDRYGRLFIQTDTQYLQLGDRTSIPVVMAIGKADWRDAIKIERRPVHPVSSLDASGAADSLTEFFFSRASGKIYSRYGAIETRDNLLVFDQTDMNQKSGMIYAQRNNMYPVIEIPLVGNNRMMDIAPLQRVTLTVAAEDTPRGIVWTNKLLLPRRVEFIHDAGKGALQVDIECEAETDGLPGVTIIPPAAIIKPRITPPPHNPPNPPWVPGFTPPPPPYKPPPPNIEPGICTTGTYPPNGPYNVGISGEFFNDDIYEWSNDFNVTLRIETQHYLSKYMLNGFFYKLNGVNWDETTDDDFYDVVAVLDDNSEIAATHDAVTNTHSRTGYWGSLPANTHIKKIKIVMRGSAGLNWSGHSEGIGNAGCGLGNANQAMSFSSHAAEDLNGSFHWNGVADWWTDECSYNTIAVRCAVNTEIPHPRSLRIRASCVIASDADSVSGVRCFMGNYYLGYPYPYYQPYTFTYLVAPQNAVDQIVDWAPSGIDDGTGNIYVTFEFILHKTSRVTGHTYMDVLLSLAPSYRISINSLLMYNICP